ncbi:MAG TPA: STAS/SEC14 domain-containing protein [Flavobacterium sp.]|jgi:hypothetical protein
METSSKVYNIFYDRVIDAVIMEWRGYATSAEFKEGTELMLNILMKNATFKVLANIKDMTIIAKEDQEWLDADFLPRATEFGFKVLAIVKPDHYFNRVAVESISYKVDKNKLAIQFFNNLADAKSWLNLIEDPEKR